MEAMAEFLIKKLEGVLEKSYESDEMHTYIQHSALRILFKLFFSSKKETMVCGAGFYIHMGICGLLQNAIEVSNDVIRANLFLQ